MTNEVAILDCFNRTIKFKFNDEIFIIKLTEGDLHDNWNTITTGEESFFDTNFTWEDIKGQKPNFTVYPINDENQTDWDNGTTISINKKLGNRDDYFEELRFTYKFDSTLPLVFRVFDENNKLILKTKSLNKASDEKFLGNKKGKQYKLVASDSNFATKLF